MTLDSGLKQAFVRPELTEGEGRFFLVLSLKKKLVLLSKMVLSAGQQLARLENRKEKKKRLSLQMS